MIFCLICNCTGSENQARTFLRNNGVSNYMEIPITQGREACMKYLQRLPRLKEVEMLEDFLRRSTSFVVVAGFKDRMFKWSEVAHGDAASEVEGELIVQRFA